MKSTDRKSISREEVKSRLLSGAQVPLDSLSDEELQAAQPLLLSGKVEIVHSNCRPHLMAKLDRVVMDS